MLTAMEALARQPAGLHGEILLTAVMGEEAGGLGSAYLVGQGITGDGAVVGEPTGLRIASAHKGTYIRQVTFRGVAAHSASPWLGRNAVLPAAAFCLLCEEQNAILAESPHPLLGPATLTVTLISGGTLQNTVPEAEAGESPVGRRLIPNGTHPLHATTPSSWQYLSACPVPGRMRKWKASPWSWPPHHRRPRTERRSWTRRWPPPTTSADPRQKHGRVRGGLRHEQAGQHRQNPHGDLRPWQPRPGPSPGRVRRRQPGGRRRAALRADRPTLPGPGQARQPTSRRWTPMDTSPVVDELSGGFRLPAGTVRAHRRRFVFTLTRARRHRLVGESGRPTEQR